MSMIINNNLKMDVKFSDSFGDSIKKLIRHESWWYKTYSLFRYDIPRFIKNVWRFRKALSNYYWWDHHGMLTFTETALTHMSDNLELYGNEIEEPRMKKIAAMRRAAELIRNYNESNYIEMAEAELGEIVHYEWEFEETGETKDNPFGEKNEKLYQLIEKETDEEKAHNRKVYDRSTEIEKQEWDELFRLLKGQDSDEYSALYQSKTEEEKKARDIWYDWFDGSGIKGWWD
jgi:hypothetical protein